MLIDHSSSSDTASSRHLLLDVPMESNNLWVADRYISFYVPDQRRIRRLLFYTHTSSLPTPTGI